jgi:hypothetical protein
MSSSNFNYRAGGSGHFSYNSSTSSSHHDNDPDTTSATSVLRRRATDTSNGSSYYNNSSSNNNNNNKRGGAVTAVKKLDFMFPKVDNEYKVKTDGGGIATMIAYTLITLFCLAEIIAWRTSNGATTEHIRVDTSLGGRMRVNVNITFPGLACEDLHVDVMDVAGDSQLNIEDTMIKKRMRHGKYIGESELAESNAHKKQQAKKQRVLDEHVPADYCGPCFGAQENDSSCCNTCDELIKAYDAKRWRTDIITMTAEQCIREGRDKRMAPKRMKHGEGCNLSGSMTLNRVAGNFHIAMGEGIERDGRHIHSFVPDDTPNFNASHIVHHLSFGTPESEGESQDQASMDGVTKIVTKEFGTTGLFQYFIKVVPTTYIRKAKGGGNVETNRYFFTERFRPLNKEYYDDDDHFEVRLEC